MPKFERFDSSRDKPKKKKERKEKPFEGGAGAAIDGLIGLATFGVVNPPEGRKKKKN